MSRRRTNGGEDQDGESWRLSLDNHKTWRSWETGPSQTTNRDVVGENTSSLVTSLKVTSKPPSAFGRWRTMCVQDLLVESQPSPCSLVTFFKSVSAILYSDTTQDRTCTTVWLCGQVTVLPHVWWKKIEFFFCPFSSLFDPFPGDSFPKLSFFQRKKIGKKEWLRGMSSPVTSKTNRPVPPFPKDYHRPVSEMESCRSLNLWKCVSVHSDRWPVRKE